MNQHDTTALSPSPAKRTAWRDLDYATKFLVVNRWSLIIFPWIAALAFIGTVSARLPVSDAAMWAGMAVAVLSCTAGSLALHTNASLRMHPHPHGEMWLHWGLTAHLVALGVCALLVFFGPEPLMAASALAAGPLFFTTMLAYLPFLERGATATALLLVAVFGVVAVVASPGLAIVIVGYGVVFALVAPFTKWLSRAMIETDRARRLETQLSAAQERLRLSQDLHDTMGQHLAAMTIKTQLAQALAARKDPRLDGELAELHQLTQRAAADMRRVVNSYRTPDLAKELSGAKQVLTDAGAHVTVTGSAAEVSSPLRETAAWFIRETATNILRHSQATEVTVDITPRAITVTNNHPEPSERPGTGLEGLRRRAAEHGALIKSEQTPALFTVTLEEGA